MDYIFTEFSFLQESLRCSACSLYGVNYDFPRCFPLSSFSTDIAKCFLGPTMYYYIAKQLLCFLCVSFNISIVPVLLISFTENQNLRTIIVIADIDRGLHSPAHKVNFMYHPCLTFRHWSGVTPYTSSYEFAGSCVFDKQSPGLFRCGRTHASMSSADLIPKLRSLFCRVP